MVTDALSPVQIVEQWQERAWGDFDLTAVDDLVAEPLLRHGPSGTVKRSHDELKRDLIQYQRTLGKPTITVHDRVVQVDCVWSRVKMCGHNMETGQPRTVDWLQVHRIVDGKIAELWSLYATDVTW